MNKSTDHGESTRNNLETLPIEIKQMIAEYLPIHPFVNLKMCSKDLNKNVQFGKQLLDKLYQNKKLFNNVATFKKVLLEDGRSDPSANDNSAIKIASDDGHTEIVKMLLNDERVDPSADDNYAIGSVPIFGHTEIVRMLLQDERVDPSAYDNLAIRFASERGHTDIVRMLLKDERVDPSADINSAVLYASERGHTEIVQILLKDNRLRIDAARIKTILDRACKEDIKIILKDKLSKMENN
ncbi:hypothetical protein BC833DRAFT_612022 [Globomyces pollinis-pini]|nr:hypothetical protein BC833DRAFT_612022 [Globomyces pollinis-pini]